MVQKSGEHIQTVVGNGISEPSTVSNEKSTGFSWNISAEPNPDAPWDWYIYLHLNNIYHTFKSNLGCGFKQFIRWSLFRGNDPIWLAHSFKGVWWFSPPKLEMLIYKQKPMHSEHMGKISYQTSSWGEMHHIPSFPSSEVQQLRGFWDKPRVGVTTSIEKPMKLPHF